MILWTTKPQTFKGEDDTICPLIQDPMIHVFSNASQLYGVLGKQLSQPKLV